MNLRIITEEKEIASTDASSVTLPGSIGEMTILPGHAKLLSILQKGAVRYNSTGGINIINIDGGVVEVLNDKITIMCR